MGLEVCREEMTSIESYFLEILLGNSAVFKEIALWIVLLLSSRINRLVEKYKERLLLIQSSSSITFNKKENKKFSCSLSAKYAFASLNMHFRKFISSKSRVADNSNLLLLFR